MTQSQSAKFAIAQVVRHKDTDFRGVIMDVDLNYDGPVDDIVGISPTQPFYRVLVSGEGKTVVVYAAEESLLQDADVLPSEHLRRWFNVDAQGHRAPLHSALN